MSQRLRLLCELARGLIFVTVPIVWSITETLLDAISIAAVWMPTA